MSDNSTKYLELYAALEDESDNSANKRKRIISSVESIEPSFFHNETENKKLEYVKAAQKKLSRSDYFVFNQIILEEYRELDVLTETDYKELKAIVFYRILKLFSDNKWSLLKERENFRKEIHDEIYARVHLSRSNPVALCFSGGGIRSGTFGLGVLQALAKNNLLDKFTYLSTVSGGGFIGSWLTAFIHRNKGNVAEVQKKLNSETEPQEIRYLRSYSNYMTPKTGLLSLDTLTLIGIYLRNLLLNWTVLLPFLAAFLLIPKLFNSLFWEYSKIFERNWPLDLFSAATGVLGFSAAAGVIAVLQIHAMRPTLASSSWFKSNYRTDEIGITKSVEMKVLALCGIPLLTFAFGTAVYWRLANTAEVAPINAAYFGTAIFGGGYLLSRIAFLLYKLGRVEFSWSHQFVELIISLLCGAVGGLIIYVASLVSPTIGAGYKNTIYVCAAPSVILLVFLLAATLFIGIASKITDDMDREWFARFGSAILFFAIGWFAISSIVLFSETIIEKLGTLPSSIGGGLSGLIALIFGYFSKSETGEKSGGIISYLPVLAAKIAAPIFIVLLFVGISYATNELVIKSPGSFYLNHNFVWVLIFGAFGAFMGSVVNVNKFSLHSAYRDRLIRAYLGASRAAERLKTANSFTGLDDDDNIQLCEIKNSQKPFHVINSTLNLNKTSNLDWQQRRSEPFTFTPMYCGSSQMGNGSGNYRATRDYAHNEQNNKSITLGTALAVSGAAASPNMGYFTQSSAVVFLMTLFNVRLGWWFGNTGKRGETSYKLSCPRWSPTVFLTEALGLTNDQRKYIYLSDGGHFDNLGLYEMVLRRCHLIVVCDAAADKDWGFSDFGKAVHQIRVDTGISIEFEKKHEPKQKCNVAVANIKYSEVDNAGKDGVLIYIKPTLDGKQPIDIVNYSKANPDFPNESTTDQFYSEMQFEAYRRLGFDMVNSFCGKSISKLEGNAKAYLNDLPQ